MPSSASMGADESRTRSGAGPDCGSASARTVGGWLAGGFWTVISISPVALAPPGSRAVTVAVNVPACRYVCSTTAPNCPPPSPKSHS